MKQFKKLCAILTAGVLCATGLTSLGAATVSAESAEIAQAYFIGSFGAEPGNWEAGENEGVSITSVNGDAQYEVNWNLTNSDGATETGDSWMLAVCITPTNGVETFTTDTFPDLSVTLDAVYVNGQKLDYTVSEKAIDLKYYEKDPGVTRIYLHDDWAGTGVADLASGVIEGSIKAVFTISGTGQEGTSNVASSGSDDTGKGGEDGSGEVGQAYLIGSFGAEPKNFNVGENEGVSVTTINGDAQYEVVWNLTTADGATETGDSWFLAVCIAPANGAENFNTDTFENLSVSLDEVWVNGKKLEDYTVSSKAIDTKYYESGAGVTRIYLHDDWAGTGVADLASGTIAGSVKAVFTVNGLGWDGTSNVGENEVNVFEGGGTGEYTLGDVDQNNTISTLDAYYILLECAMTAAKYDSTLDENQKLAADVNKDGKINTMDAYYVLLYCAMKAAKYEVTWEDIT